MPDKPAPGAGGAGGDKPASGAGGFISKKVGPLPLWGWAAIGGAAMLALRIFTGGSGKKEIAGVVGQAAPASSSGGSSGASSPRAGVSSGSEFSNRDGSPLASIPVVDSLETFVTPALSPAAAHVTRMEPPKPTDVGKTAAQLSGGLGAQFTEPPALQQVSDTRVTVVDTAGRIGGVNPANVLAGYSGPDGKIYDSPGPGRVAIWR